MSKSQIDLKDIIDELTKIASKSPSPFEAARLLDEYADKAEVGNMDNSMYNLLDGVLTDLTVIGEFGGDEVQASYSDGEPAGILECGELSMKEFKVMVAAVYEALNRV